MNLTGIVRRVQKKAQIRKVLWELEHYDTPNMNLLERFQMNSEIRKAMYGLGHPETLDNASENVSFAYSVLEKYRERISPEHARHFQEQIMKAEVNFRNSMIGYLI
jgi:hypothetical protein